MESKEELLNRLEQNVLGFLDMKHYLIGLAHDFPKEVYPEIISYFVNNELRLIEGWFKITYAGIETSHVYEKYHHEILEGMGQLMGWEKEENRSKILAINWIKLGLTRIDKGKFNSAISCLKNALHLEPENLVALELLIKAHLQKGDREKVNELEKEYSDIEESYRFDPYPSREVNPLQEYETLLKSYYYKKKYMSNLLGRRSYFRNLFGIEKCSLIEKCKKIMMDISNYIQGKENKIPKSIVHRALDEILSHVFGWISILSGIIYYKLKYDFGIKKELYLLMDDIYSLLH